MFVRARGPSNVPGCRPPSARRSCRTVFEDLTTAVVADHSSHYARSDTPACSSRRRRRPGDPNFSKPKEGFMKEHPLCHAQHDVSAPGEGAQRQ